MAQLETVPCSTTERDLDRRAPRRGIGAPERGRARGASPMWTKYKLSSRNYKYKLICVSRSLRCRIMCESFSASGSLDERDPARRTCMR
eukprot:scaffold12331_cov31-Tisochrysis_lutea.AAC.3